VTDVTGEVVGSTWTDGSGRYALEQLMGGDYVLTAQHDGRRPVGRAVEVPDSGTLALDLHLPGGGRLNGVVVTASDGRALRKATVSLVDAAGTVVGTVTTDSDGRYGFEDLDAGHYTLSASGYASVTTALELQEDGVCVVKIALGGAVSTADDSRGPALQLNRG
jgi:hypothetical protein